MIKQLATMGAVAAASFAFANAATIIDADTQTAVVAGVDDQEFIDTGFVGPETDATVIDYEFLPVGGDVDFDISVSGTDTIQELELIVVTRNGPNGTFNGTFRPNEDGVASGGSFVFDSFTTSEAFSIVINGQDLSDATPYTITVFANRTGDNVGEIPVPAAGLLMMTALGGFGLARRQRKNA